ncbi:hypothetical protein T4B_9115 [Trichinella pseudospiralis]|uniref:Uncharacterized protein n=2 Tax=Trichinella pseudospiralis TaxID=6337 RepID=A0A0V1DTB4_TRIPS|nr:hypothetical protein T4A_6212 [Trichinella pseudospiralis]KRZ00882.1 hypothetical protein T4B_9115 [Trichinella pseudospiralis]
MSSPNFKQLNSINVSTFTLHLLLAFQFIAILSVKQIHQLLKKNILSSMPSCPALLSNELHHRAHNDFKLSRDCAELKILPDSYFQLNKQRLFIVI